MGIGAGIQAQRHHFGHGLRPFGRVEPSLAQRVQAVRGFANAAGGLHQDKFIYILYVGFYFKL